jgi:hypothetical protein
MAYAYTAQANNAASASGTTLTVNFTVSAGDKAIVVYGSFSGVLTTLSLSDGTHTYTQAGSAGSVASTATHRISGYYVLNPTPGSYTLTMTVGATRANRRVAVATYQGVVAYQTAVNQGQLAAATTADAVSTSAMTPSSQPAMLTALSFTANGTTTYSAGTGHTSRGVLSNWDAIGSFSSLLEDIRLTSTSAVSGLFTITNSLDTLSQGLILTEAVSATVSGQTLTATASLIAGTAFANDASVAAQTLTATALLFAGSASAGASAALVRRGLGLRNGIWL